MRLVLGKPGREEARGSEREGGRKGGRERSRDRKTCLQEEGVLKYLASLPEAERGKVED